jgi:tRNA dimethylallyltransferase
LKKKKRKRDFNIIVLGMNQERLDLYKKINTRVDNMVESGLINEVKELYTLKGLNTLNTIGYSEVFNYIEDKYSLDECINEIKKNTRRYAKRQLTWFKSIDRVEWITPDYTFEKVIAYIKNLIGN